MVRPGSFGTDLADLASYLLRNGPRKIIPTPRRIRVIYNNTTIVDSTKAVWVWEHDAYPQYYFPVAELKHCSTRDRRSIRSDGLHRAAVVELAVPQQRNGIPEGGLIACCASTVIAVWAVYLINTPLDSWLEEDTPIHVHPKDPFKRINILPSIRPIEVKVAGKTVARSPYSVHLHETGLPTRYYLPLAAVDQAALRRSSLVTSCPYKGDAEYYDVVVDGVAFSSLIWYYKTPTHEATGIEGLLCFYNEKVDICLDGQLLERPSTLFSQAS